MSLFYPALERAIDASGLTMPGAKWYFYQSGTLTPISTYTASDLVTAQPSPVVADSGGLFPSIYLASGAYRAILKSAAGVTQQDIDPYVVEAGGNVISVGLFSNAHNLNIPAGIDVIATLGYNVMGKGVAQYAYDATVTTNTSSTFMSANGRGFRLAEPIITPFMFGAVGGGGALTDDTVPLQAAFDFLFDPGRRRNTSLDWSGTWSISDTVYMAYTYLADEPPARITCGTLHILPVAQQPGGVPMQKAIVISGVRNSFDGLLYIQGFQETDPYVTYLTPTLTRRLVDGIWCCQTNGSTMPDIRVDGTIRSPVVLRTDLATIRPGSPYQVTLPANNMISTKFGSIYARLCGSLTADGSFKHVQPLTFTSNTPGGITPNNVDINLCPWDPTPGSYGGSDHQASRLAVTDYGYLRNSDWIQLFLEIPGATCGTVALSKTGSTMTWSAGDPVAAGLQVGDKISIRHDIPGQVPVTDNYVYFEIISFGGTSNRTIKIDPAPDVDMAAFAVQKLRTKPTLHWVVRVGTGFVDVFPWVPTRVASGTAYCVFGAVLDAPGADASGVTVDLLTANQTAIGINSAGLFGPHIETAVIDQVDIGITQGLSIGAASAGGRVDYIHSEATLFDLVQLRPSISYSNFYIGSATSLLRTGCVALVPKLAPADTNPPIGTDCLVNASINFGDQKLLPSIISADPASTYALSILSVSNLPANRERRCWADSGSMNISFDPDFARMTGDCNWAKVIITGAGGGTPSGTFTFTMDAAMQLRGWQFIGLGTRSPGDAANGAIADQVTAISGLTGSCTLHFLYNRTTKKVNVLRSYFS